MISAANSDGHQRHACQMGRTASSAEGMPSALGSRAGTRFMIMWRMPDAIPYFSRPIAPPFGWRRISPSRMIMDPRMAFILEELA